MSPLILFNKPYGVLSQFTDREQGRSTLAEFIPLSGIYVAGRLDLDSEGLLLLTDDGRLQASIADPRHKMPKVYWVQVEGIPDEAALETLRRGVMLNDGPTRTAQARMLEEPVGLWPRDPPIRFRATIPSKWIELVLREGRNRQVRRMTAAVGYPTLRLIRQAIGEWTLDGLAPGQWREIQLPASLAPSSRHEIRVRPKKCKFSKMKAFTTLKDIATHQEIIKNSIFIAYAARAESQEQAFEFLRDVLSRHPDVSHLCWAYRIGDLYRFSDGGEPGGTAGQPILRAIEGQDLDHVVVGVIRYWGGVKLGAGGLMRAYGGTAAEALRTAERQVVSPRVAVIVETGFEHISALYRALDACSAEERAEDYHELGVRLTASLPANELDRLRILLRDGTRGQCQLLVVS